MYMYNTHVHVHVHCMLNPASRAALVARLVQYHHQSVHVHVHVCAMGSNPTQMYMYTIQNTPVYLVERSDGGSPTQCHGL